MADFIQILIDFLKINCSVVNCNYPNPIETVFYLLFFPSVFIILLGYILTNFIFRADGTKPVALRLLISITLYAFIVMQGLFNLFIPLSQAWWLVAVLLLGLWAFLKVVILGKGHGGEEGGSPRIPGMPAVFKKIHTGEAKDLKRAAEEELETLEGILHSMKKPSPATDMGSLIDEFTEQLKVAKPAIEAYKNLGRSGNIDVFKLANEYEKKYNKLVHEFNVLMKKAA